VRRVAQEHDVLSQHRSGVPQSNLEVVRLGVNACHTGTTTCCYSGDDPEMLANVGNAATKAKFPFWTWTTIKSNDGYAFTTLVGKLNTFGLYDMHGNAFMPSQPTPPPLTLK
jgi:hypothetical protein